MKPRRVLGNSYYCVTSRLYEHGNPLGTGRTGVVFEGGGHPFSSHNREEKSPKGRHMAQEFDVLIVSTSPEDQKALMRVLDNLSANVIACSTVRQAEEVLSQRTIGLIFCDKRLPDGTYRELLAIRQAGKKMPRVVVTTRVGGWEDYTEATELGAFDVIPCPLQPTNVEFAVMRAMRNEEAKAFYATA